MARPKKASASLSSIDECTAAMAELLTVTVSLEARVARRDRAVAKLQARYEPSIDDFRQRSGDLKAQMEDYYYKHIPEIEAGTKHLQLSNGRIGRRTNPEALKPLNRQWTWKRILDLVKIKYEELFLKRKDPELDLEKIKAAKLTAEELKQVGLKLEAGETFYAEPARPAGSGGGDAMTMTKGQLLSALMVAAAIGLAMGSALHHRVHEDRTEDIAKANRVLAQTAIAEHAAARENEEMAREVSCLATDGLWVEGVIWHIRQRNACSIPITRKLYVLLAFYDVAGYRNGFTWFITEPLAPGERTPPGDLHSKTGSCPREGVSGDDRSGRGIEVGPMTSAMKGKRVAGGALPGQLSLGLEPVWSLREWVLMKLKDFTWRQQARAAKRARRQARRRGYSK